MLRSSADWAVYLQAQRPTGLLFYSYNLFSGITGLLIYIGDGDTSLRAYQTSGIYRFVWYLPEDSALCLNDLAIPFEYGTNEDQLFPTQDVLHMGMSLFFHW